MPEPVRVMFLYWGRRGALARIAHDLMAAAASRSDLAPVLSVSRQSESFDSYRPFGDRLHVVDTFSGLAGALLGAVRLPAMGRALEARLRADRIVTVINLMPHLWTGAMVAHVHRAGARHAVIVHDASPHPGDPTAIVNGLLLREARRADCVVTLSRAVHDRLVADGVAPPARIATLYHPDLTYRAAATPPAYDGTRPLRLLFFGRILPYKGLGLFVEALELLRAHGFAVEAGVFGEGDVAPYRERLAALGAEVGNRWIGEADIAGIFVRYHAVALSHIEASQSGVAAAALASGLPVVATPVGGLVEQVEDGVTGILASAATAAGFAGAVERLIRDPALHGRMARRLGEAAGQRPMQRFLDDLLIAAGAIEASR